VCDWQRSFRDKPPRLFGGMRYVVAALIAILGLGACTEAARRAVGPGGDVKTLDPTLIPADTIVDCRVSACPGPTAASPGPALPKIPESHKGPGSVVMSFVIDTSGSVIRNSVQIEIGGGKEYADAFREWLSQWRFAPVLRGGRPVRAAIRNLQLLYQERRQVSRPCRQAFVAPEQCGG